MKMYWVSSYYLKENKALEYQQWLLGEEATQLLAEVEKETGIRYMNTYWAILGFGEYDVEEWWEVPNWTAMDSIRESKAMDKFFTRTNELDFVNPNRPASNRMLRSTKDVKIMAPPEVKEKKKKK